VAVALDIVMLGAKRCGTNNFGWKQYDEHFRLNMAEHPNANWVDVDVELWLLYINPIKFEFCNNNAKSIY
jgi:hypothetical protein